MGKKHLQYYRQIKDLVLTHLNPVLVRKLADQVLLIEQARSSLSDYYKNIDQEGGKIKVLEMLRKMRALKESLAHSVKGFAVVNEEVDLDQDFKTYFEELIKYTESLPETLTENQSIDRFQPFPNDKFRLKIIKRVKKWSLILGWVPRKIANWFRVKTKKEIKPITTWEHIIPLRGLIIYHFRDLLIEQLTDLIQAIYRVIAASTHDLYEIEAGMDQKFATSIGEEQNNDLVTNANYHAAIDQMLSRVQELTESIPGIVENRFERVTDIFQANYELVGTVELPAANFKASGLEAVHRQAKKSYKKTVDGWQNTLAVLSDRYNFDHELFKTRFTNLEQYLFLSQKLEAKISEKILGEINTISEFLSTKKHQLEMSSTRDEDFKKTLKEIRYDTSKYLNQAIPACIRLIVKQNIPSLLENLEAKTKHQVAQLSESRSMVKNISYEHPIKESDIDKIAPKDLITFEALPEYLEKIHTLWNEFTQVIESTQQQLMEISNICDFNLETALTALSEESQHSRARSMSIEGIERAHSRCQDIIEGLSDLASKGEKTIHKEVDDFNDRIMALSQIDAVFDTQVRIAKAKAVEKTKAFRARLFNQLKLALPRLITKTKRRGLMVYKWYRDTSLKYGISNPTQVLSAEISSFLGETEHTVRNLPFVYQRLFEISPLENLYFYEPRPLTILSLKKAFENWEQNHHGATALIAEAGSGVTTLMHFFVQELKSNIPVVYARSTQQIYRTSQLFKFFSEVLKVNDLSDTESMVDYLNRPGEKRIIVLDDFEHFFLRKVNGFDCITTLLELITLTNRNVFWLTSIDHYSYKYLDKTLNINDYFGYNIYLKPFKPQEVTSLVLKRHRVSGFSINFIPDRADRKNSKFKKMTESQRQEYLHKEYFLNLNRIAQSNISLALIYWIRSIREIEDDVMNIRSLKGVDFSFLTQMSDEKLYTLYAMLIHDGINIADHAMVFQQVVKKSELGIIALVDDGIAVKGESRFFINPLLYRQVVNLLSAKNIIH